MNAVAERLTARIESLDPTQLSQVERFVDLLLSSDHPGAVRDAAKLSTPSFAAIWANPEDEVYDAL